MATIGHLAVGLALGRHHAGATGPLLRSTVLLTTLAVLPDLDVLAVPFDSLCGTPLAHRGALHSLPVALVVGVLAGLAAGGLGRSRGRLAVTAALAMASHGVLDAACEVGAGIPLLWPFSAHRFLSPWRLVPVAPIGIRFVSLQGLAALAEEALVFAPALAYALWPRRTPPRAAPDAPA